METEADKEAFPKNCMTALHRIGFIVAVLSLPCLSNADDSKESRESLRGVKSFGVLIEELDHTALDLGLSVPDIQTAVELRLRLAGMKIVTARESFSLPGSPYLYVQVSTVGKVPGAIAYNVDLYFQQDVILERNTNSKIFGASTWSAGTIGTAGSAVASDAIKQLLAKLTDEFLNAYLTVNPK